MDISLHYVLAHRHDQTVPAGYAPVDSKSPFTTMNDPVRSPILETMLQRICTGTVVKQEIRNHPMYGTPYAAEAIFFRKPDGTPWVKFYEGGHPILAPVTEVGKLVQWTGRAERASGGVDRFTQYTVWSDGNDNLNGKLETVYSGYTKANRDINNGGTIEFTCVTELVPPTTWSAWSVTPGRSPDGDPP